MDGKSILEVVHKLYSAGAYKKSDFEEVNISFISSFS